MAARGRGVGALLIVTCFLSVSGEQVPEGLVYTDLHKTVKQGNEIVLKCQFLGDPIAVYWMKGENPDQSHDLISWVEGNFLSGFCLSSNLCDLDENNYSLIIRDAQIADQGRYICRVSNYLGILIHNHTDIKIFAPPNKPYPVIKQCVEVEPYNLTSAPMCGISSDNPIKITCVASGFYPDLDLFFLHGSERITSVNANEWINDNGTKNKSISIKGSASVTPYVCVVSAIPGTEGQETATITVNFRSVHPRGTEKTTPPPSLEPAVTGDDLNANTTVKIVVPVVLFVMAGMMSLVYLWWKYQQKKGGREGDKGEENVPMVSTRTGRMKVPDNLQRPVSQAELKEFARRLTGRHCRRLAKYVGVHNKDTISKILDENCGMLFNSQLMISKWISGLTCSDYDKRCKTDDLLLTIGRHDMTDVLGTIPYRQKSGKMCEHVHPGEKYDDEGIFDDDLSYLSKLMQGLSPEERSNLRKMKDKSSKEERNEEMNLDKEELRDLISGNMIADAEKASLRDFLKHLESTVGRSFCEFDVADDELECVAVHVHSDDKREELLSSLHIDCEKFKELTNRCKIVEEKEIGQESRHPFETDVRAEPGTAAVNPPSPYQSAPNENRREDEYPAVDDIQNIASNVQEVEPCQETKVNDIEAKELTHSTAVKTSKPAAVNTQGEEEASSGIDHESQKHHIFVNVLKKWKNEQTTESCRKALRDALEKTGYKECIVRETPGTHMYEAELVRIAFSMLMRDILPVIKAIGMEPSTACQYKRPVQDLEEGTIGLLMRLWEETKSDEHRRRNYCLHFKHIGYIDLAKLLYLDYEQSLSEMYRIVSVLDETEMKEFVNTLGLSKDAIADCTSDDGHIDRLKVMRMWKNQIRPVPYHYRAVATTGLKDIGRESLADKVIQGHYQTKEPEEDVISDLCSLMHVDQVRALCKILELQPAEDRARSTERVVQWVSEYMEEFNVVPASWIPLNSGTTVYSGQHHLEKNNKLVRAGFYDLAEEIMILERCLGA